MQSLERVFKNYRETKVATGGKATFTGSADQVSLTQELPEFFRKLLADAGRVAEFKVKGSFGNGNMPDVPWVAIFNRTVTESAQDGYYIVLLFSEDMGSCYLSLNQGVTTFEKQYSTTLARTKIRDTAERALKLIAPSPDTLRGPIGLAATGRLGKGYELGAIASFRYERGMLPDEETVREHFRRLLAHYDRLVPVAGDTLQSLSPVTETEYQHEATEKARRVARSETTSKAEPAGGVQVPPKGVLGQSGRYMRNPTVAARALARAGFKCEIDRDHETFLSMATNLPYVEAHHLIPIGQQPHYPFSLDVTANVVALCPLCHRRLHHATQNEKREHLRKLLELRKEALGEKQIPVSLQDLIEHYKGELDEDEA